MIYIYTHILMHGVADVYCMDHHIAINAYDDADSLLLLLLLLLLFLLLFLLIVVFVAFYFTEAVNIYHWVFSTVHNFART